MQAFAQSLDYNSQGNPSTTPATAATPAVFPCINPTLPPYNADPTGAIDSTHALQAAINDAQAVTNSATRPGLVCIPGGRYVVSGKITISSGNVTICGTGYNNTRIFPSQQDDVFYVALPTPKNYISSVNFCGFRIFRKDDPIAGAGIHYVGADISTVENVEVDGTFYAYWCESCLQVKFNFANALGNNMAAGSRLYRFSKGTYPGARDNSEIYLTDIDARASSRGAVETAFEVNNADGIGCFHCHLGFSSGPALKILPGSTTDQLTGIIFPGATFDSAQYGVYISQPANYTAKFGDFNFNGAWFFIAALDGLYVDSSATSLTAISAPGARFLINKRNGINLNAGKHYVFTGAQFLGNNNGNTGGVHAMIGGTTTSVNLDGSMFATDVGAHAVPYNIVTSGTADRLYGSHLDFQNAATANMSLGASGRHVDLVAAP
jgi:hypothetical protein